MNFSIASFTHDGITFTWPDAQPAADDNVVAGSQTVALPGATGSTLGLIGTGDYGAASGNGNARLRHRRRLTRLRHPAETPR